MGNFTLYHNPRCSKSRQTLALLQENQIEPDIILYLENPPTQRELTKILEMMHMSAKDLLRVNEPEYKELELDDPQCTDNELIKLMVQHPRLMQRPIAIANGKAVLARPPEKVLELL